MVCKLWSVYLHCLRLFDGLTWVRALSWLVNKDPESLHVLRSSEYPIVRMHEYAYNQFIVCPLSPSLSWDFYLIPTDFSGSLSFYRMFTTSSLSWSFYLPTWKILSRPGLEPAVRGSINGSEGPLMHSVYRRLKVDFDDEMYSIQQKKANWR